MAEQKNSRISVSNSKFYKVSDATLIQTEFFALGCMSWLRLRSTILRKNHNTCLVIHDCPAPAALLGHRFRLKLAV